MTNRVLAISAELRERRMAGIICANIVSSWQVTQGCNFSTVSEAWPVPHDSMKRALQIPGVEFRYSVHASAAYASLNEQYNWIVCLEHLA